MLNMSSGAAPTTPPDRTARARIRDAAIAKFGEHGVAATSLKVIAAEAGVSQPLIVHHFGSKDGLRRACDERVAATIRASKLAAMSQGPGLDPLVALRDVDDRRPVLRYLARTLADGTPEVAALIDEMVDDAVEYTAEGERTGLLRPSDRPRERVVILSLWSLGLLVLHEHLERLLGVDLLGDADEIGPYVLTAAEILGKGVLAEGLYERMGEALGLGEDGRSS